MLIIGALALWCIPALLLVAARWINPPTTAVQAERRVQAWIHHKPYQKRYKFIPLSQISPELQHAVIAAEDSRFYQHHGFDWHEIQIAAEDDLDGDRTRGASTLTQQLIKNLFFGTNRSYLRKGVEASLVPVAEFVLGKRRILELYLNVVEWGPGIYGAEAACRYPHMRPARTPMWIIGCDFHPRFQQIAFVNTETGEYGQRRLEHREEAERFYGELRGQAVRVGMEASGHGRWFQRLLAELGHELWIGNPAEIRAAVPRKQKTDMRNAEHLLRLLPENRFEKLRIWIPTPEQRDVRQLVVHRHRLVQLRARVKNQLQAVALNEAMPRKPGLWSRQGRQQFESFPSPLWTARQRQDNLELLEQLVHRIAPLDDAVNEQAEQRPEAVRLMTHPGVGMVTALSFVLVIGDPSRFARGQLQ